MSFPTTPSYIGQKWLDGGRVWQWNGAAWQAANNSVFWEEIAGKPTYIGNAIVSTSAPANPIPGLQWWNPTADRIFIWDGAAWVEPNTSTTYPWDADAANYIYRVEAADGQELEQATRKAINAFVIGCKTDNIWNAITECMVIAGARSFAGAFVPLKGNGATNINFQSSDYNRKTGLKGNGSSKYLNTGKTNDQFPIHSRHMYGYLTEPNTVGSQIIGTRQVTAGAWYVQTLKPNNVIRWAALASSAGYTSQVALNSTNNIGGFGVARTPLSETTSNAVIFSPGTFSTISNTAVTPTNNALWMFRDDATASPADFRLSFYSMGEAVNLQLLNARTTTLMSDLQTSIP